MQECDRRQTDVRPRYKEPVNIGVISCSARPIPPINYTFWGPRLKLADELQNWLTKPKPKAVQRSEMLAIP